MSKYPAAHQTVAYFRQLVGRSSVVGYRDFRQFYPEECLSHYFGKIPLSGEPTTATLTWKSPWYEKKGREDTRFVSYGYGSNKTVAAEDPCCTGSKPLTVGPP